MMETSFIGYRRGKPGGKVFHAMAASSGELLPGDFSGVLPSEVDESVHLAGKSLHAMRQQPPGALGAWLGEIATRLEKRVGEVCEAAVVETGLPTGRMEAETARTVNQLRLFAGLAESGSWLDARIDSALPQRKPTPRPDLRSMFRPLGPVVVFGASNFPLAFSVLGGDTAAALAAGCPVIFKAHPAHPRTSVLTAGIAVDAARDAGLPEGIFSVLLDSGHDAGKRLVKHPGVRAVAFTGSRTGGMELVKLAGERRRPIPVFAEMSSLNPVILLPGSLAERGGEIARGLHVSVTMGVGQFCTKPGIVFVPKDSNGRKFSEAFCRSAADTEAMRMLTPAILNAYRDACERRAAHARVRTLVAGGVAGDGALPSVFACDLEDFTDGNSAEWEQEIFGPSVLLVYYHSTADLMPVVNNLEGQLSASVFAAATEFDEVAKCMPSLEDIAGRILFNQFPTGVDVGKAIVHGGPFPATSDGKYSSVGARSIVRFVRPICWQGVPDVHLPAALQSGNPLQLPRMVDGADVGALPSVGSGDSGPGR